MIRKICIFSLIFSFVIFFSQIPVKVLDAENQKPVPYAKLILKDRDYYKNTEENGETLLEKDEEILEILSYGYEKLKIETPRSIYFLKPAYTAIEKVKITTPKFENMINIGEIRNENSSLGGFRANWTIVTYFAYDERYSQTPFITSVKFLTQVKGKKKKAKVRLVFYKNENNKPSDKIWKSYIVECSARKNITEYTLEKPVKFPEEGIFVGFEWINSKENIFKQKYYTGSLNVMKDYNSIYVNTQKSETDEIWVLGKIIWNTPEEKNNKTGNFRQEGWLDYKNFTATNLSDCWRLSVQLELTN